jgi:hypothetical protein
MRNKKLLGLVMLWTLLIISSGSIFGQGSFGVGFKSGIRVQIRTTIDGMMSNIEESTKGHDGLKVNDPISTARTVGHRVFFDPKHKLFFGYDLEIWREAGGSKFRVKISPLTSQPQDSLKKILGTPANPPRFPEELLIDNGDIIKLVVMENKETGDTVTDFIKISFGEEVAPFYPFAEIEEARDFTINDVAISFHRFEVFINGNRVLKGGGGASGRNVGIYLKGRGMFIMSLFPYQGLPMKKIGIATNNKIEFVYKGDHYKLISGGPVVGSGGKWNLWVINQSDYVPDSGEDVIEVSTFDDLTFLMKPEKQP